MSTDLSRRRFIGWAASAGSLLLAGCGRGIVRGDLAPSPAPSTESGDRDRILRWGTLAPSRHNVQPWQVRLRGTTAFGLGLDPERRLPAVDPSGREAAVALGAFVENVALGAAHLGYDAEVELLAGPVTTPELLRATLRRMRRRSRASIEPVERRVTVRADYVASELRKADIAWLESFPGVLYHPGGSRASTLLDEATLDAGTHQVGRDAAQAELARLIHWNDDAAKRRRDGYTVASLGLSGIAAFYARRFMDRASVMQPSFRRRTVARLEELVARKAGWVVITSADDSPASWLDAGRRMQRVFIGLRSRSLAVQPMAPALEEGLYRETVERALEIPGRVQVLARIGYVGEYPDPVSLRRPVRDIVAVPQEAA